MKKEHSPTASNDLPRREQGTLVFQKPKTEGLYLCAYKFFPRNVLYTVSLKLCESFWTFKFSSVPIAKKRILQIQHEWSFAFFHTLVPELVYALTNSAWSDSSNYIKDWLKFFFHFEFNNSAN